MNWNRRKNYNSSWCTCGRGRLKCTLIRKHCNGQAYSNTGEVGIDLEDEIVQCDEEAQML